MKKATVALLVVLLLASFGLFADEVETQGHHPQPGCLNACLELNACIPSISWMWIGDCCEEGEGPSMANNFHHGPGCTEVAVTCPGEQNIGKCLYTLSNNRCGYEITMKAKALKSSLPGFQDAFINFTASCGGAIAPTNDDAWCYAPCPVETYSELTCLQVTSNEIGLDVNPMEYMMAVSGRYTGMVFFQFTAN